MEILQKRENFLKILGKLYLKFEQLSNNIFIEILTYPLRKFLEKFVDISGKLSGMNVAKI